MKLITVIPRYGTYVSPIELMRFGAFEVKTNRKGLAGEVATKRITTDLIEKQLLLG